MYKVLGQKELVWGVSYKYMCNTMVLSVFIYRFLFFIFFIFLLFIVMTKIGDMLLTGICYIN